MKKIFLSSLFAALTVTSVTAQSTGNTDTLHQSKVTVHKDSRLDELIKKEAAFNDGIASNVRSARGYRLMLLSTNDRPLAMKVRTQLLQRYPDQKVYMSFQPPYIKLKFGNFLEKEEAENFKKDIMKSKLVTTNVYVIPETIEIKPDKNKDKDKESN